MFKHLAHEASILLITHNIVSEEKRDAYTYGFEIFFEKLFFYGIIFIIALLTKTLLFSTLFILAYKMLRQYTGGFHCKTAELCLVNSVLIYLSVMLLFILDKEPIRLALAISASVSAIIIFIFSPKESTNRPLEIKEKKKYRMISIINAALLAIIVAISYRLNISFLFYSTACSLTADAVLIILSLRRCKFERKNAEDSGCNG